MIVVTSVSEYQNVTACIDWAPMHSETNHFCRLYYIHSGEAYYFDKDTCFRFQAEHIYLLPNNKSYRLNQNPADRINHLYCHITTSTNITSPICVKVEKNSTLFHAIELLIKNVKSDNFHIILKMVDLIVSLMIEENLSEEDPLMSDPAHQIKSYIDQHYTEDISLNDIADNLHFSKPHIIRLFQKAFNLSPIKYLMQLRLEAALHYIKSGEAINVISDNLHYSNPANFSIAFKRHYGMSPTEYLRIINEDNIYSKTFLPSQD